jgi:hypothetical protein
MLRLRLRRRRRRNEQAHCCYCLNGWSTDEIEVVCLSLEHGLEHSRGLAWLEMASKLVEMEMKATRLRLLRWDAGELHGIAWISPHYPTRWAGSAFAGVILLLVPTRYLDIQYENSSLLKPALSSSPHTLPSIPIHYLQGLVTLVVHLTLPYLN